MKDYYVYIMTNKDNSVLYVGVTNDLVRRIYEHKNDLVEGFTQKYNVHKLVYFEQTTDVYSAITREKQLKAFRRAKKMQLIRSFNPKWNDIDIFS